MPRFRGNFKTLYITFKCKGDTIPCPYLIGSAPKDDTVENRPGQGIMSPKVIYGQSQTTILGVCGLSRARIS